jgi:hypothetical protein
VTPLGAASADPYCAVEAGAIGSWTPAAGPYEVYGVVTAVEDGAAEGCTDVDETDVDEPVAGEELPVGDV